MKPKGPRPARDWRTVKFAEAVAAGVFSSYLRRTRMIQLRTRWLEENWNAWYGRQRGDFGRCVKRVVGRDFVSSATLAYVFDLLLYAQRFEGGAVAWPSDRSIKWAPHP